MREFWDNLMEKPKAMRASLWAGSLLLLTFLFWQYYFSSELEENEKLTKRLEDTESQIQVETTKVNSLPQLRKQLEKLNDLHEIAAQKLPKEDETDILLASISSVARNAGIDAPRFTPDPAESIKDYYAEKLVNVDMRGSFNKVAVFLDELSHIPRIVNVADITMVNPRSFRDSAGVEVDVKGVLKIFRYLKPEERIQNTVNTPDGVKNEKAKRK